MSIGLLGRKIGMTRVLSKDGVLLPVSVLEIQANRISQVKTLDNDGYTSIQLVAGNKKASRVNKALSGHFAKAEVEAGDMIQEFRVDDVSEFSAGQEISISDFFTEGQMIDVSATSKGKGFAGTVKRHNFRTQDATHGNSLSHRAPGSIGQNQTPGRVFKGKKMAGQMGNKRCTTQNLEIVKIDADRKLLLIKGAVPGAPGAMVEVKPAVKIKQERGE